jgi:hypothetical protein
MLGDWNRVNVTQGALSKTEKCSTSPRGVRHCKKHTNYLVFNDDGNTMSSRLFACPCAKHLSLAVDNAWIENNELHAKKLKEIEDKKFAEAVEILKSRKI